MNIHGVVHSSCTCRRLFFLFCFSLAGMLLTSGCIPQQQLNSLDRRVSGLAVENETQARELAALKNQLSAIRAQGSGESAGQDIETLRSSVADTAGRVEQIQAELLRLNGQLEQLSQSLSQQKDELQKFKDQVNAELAALKGVSAGKHKPESAVIPPPAEPDLYQQAMDMFKAKKYPEAKRLFRKYIEENPNGNRVPNAHFWMGECEYSRGRYEEAILEYQTVISKFPKSNKLPDALLKQGLSFERLGDMESARIVLSKLVKKYPGTSQAKVAAKQLKRLR